MTPLDSVKRRPTVQRDGIEAWLLAEIQYLERIKRTDFGDGSLAAYKRTLKELQEASRLARNRGD